MGRSNHDNAWSWLVLVSVFIAQIMLGGICLNGGLFYIIFRDALGSGTVETSWLCSLPVTLWFLSTPVGSVLVNRYGYRACVFIGGLIAAIGVCIGYFAKSTMILFMSYGFLTGFGFGVSYTGCMAALNGHFDKYKTIALGLASTGDNVGRTIYSVTIVALEHSYGWRGMMLITGALTLNMCACATVMAPTNQKTHGLNGDCKEIQPHIKQKKRINLSVFRKWSFVSFCLSNIFLNISIGIYDLYLPSYSKDVGFKETEISKLWLVFGISNVVGKVVFSFLGQHPKVNTMLLYSTSLTLTGIAIGMTPIVFGRTGLLVTTGFIGFFFCVTGALNQAVTYEIVGYDRFADGVGMSLPFKAVGSLIGGPLAGLLITTSGSYKSSFYLAGVSMIISSLIMIQPIIHQQRNKKLFQRTDIHTVYEIEASKCLPTMESEKFITGVS